MISYVPSGGEASECENWTFESDVEAAVEEVDTYSRFDKETTILNRYDGATGGQSSHSTTSRRPGFVPAQKERI